MFCSILSAAISGVEALPVSVEADVSDGMPQFSMVGFVSSQVREAQDRVRTALRNMQVVLPPKRITINLSPGDLRKEGTRFDLPIAAAVLCALGHIPEDALAGTMVMGELHLDGRVGKITGVLPSVITARDAGCRRAIVPAENLAEGRAVKGIRVVGIRTLRDLFRYAAGEELPGQEAEPQEAVPAEDGVDFGDIRGQQTVKRAALIAAAGFHNLLLQGPPGSGKSMTARRIPTILPRMSAEESLEVSRIYSIVGLLPPGQALIRERPFRAPHHGITAPALCGGGLYPRPGEVTLSHRGVLFLDELPEMNPATLEMLRQPLEDREITVTRVGGTCRYPASFLLVAAMNPCPCGYYPDRSRCTCGPREIQAYHARISQAVLDRVDIHCEVPAASYEDLAERKADAVTSDMLRRKVGEAYRLQEERYAREKFRFNSEIPPDAIDRYCPRTAGAGRMLQAAFTSLGLSARGYHHVIRVARTIADLDGVQKISEAHVSEALCCRNSDRRTGI